MDLLLIYYKKIKLKIFINLLDLIMFYILMLLIPSLSTILDDSLKVYENTFKRLIIIIKTLPS